MNEMTPEPMPQADVSITNLIAIINEKCRDIEIVANPKDQATHKINEIARKYLNTIVTDILKDYPEILHSEELEQGIARGLVGQVEGDIPAVSIGGRVVLDLLFSRIQAARRATRGE